MLHCRITALGTTPHNGGEEEEKREKGKEKRNKIMEGQVKRSKTERTWNMTQKKKTSCDKSEIRTHAQFPGPGIYLLR